MEGFERIVLSTYKPEIIQLLSASDPFANYCINVDFLKLFEADPNLGDEILCNPKNVLPKCDTALLNVQKQLINDIESSNCEVILSIKDNIRARFFGLPVCPELHRTIIPKNKDLGCFLKITGTAIRLTQAKMLEYRRNYKCCKCQNVQSVEGKYEYRYIIKAPTKCKNPNIQCRSNAFSPIYDVSRDNCRDYQEMKIQEQVNKLTVGGIPGSIWVTLEDDLVDSCKPGDDVNICGTVTRRWQPIAANKKCEVELVIKANHIEVCNAQKSIAVSLAPDVKCDFDEFWSSFKNSPMRGRDVILASVCPKVYGLYMVKLALTLTVITGCSHILDVNKTTLTKNSSPEAKANESSIRGQCHLLLVGDPGTGKSQLLKAAAMLTSRSVLTSGSGTTKAGLTCTALREDGEWQLEAGALVLADGGACCIDELAQMREHDRASIHEAMEQQTISIAKAGIVCKLNTRCAIVAACNPKGNYDLEQALSVNVSLGTPLLSRFDLIFILLDTQNKTWDSLVADYILFGKESQNFQPKSWPLEKLQFYLSLIGPYEVKMTKTAINILQAYYVTQRRAENRDPSRTTVRMLDSLVRLSQAHARLMYRKTVLPMDAITAVYLMDLSMQDCVFTGSSNVLHSTFSRYPDFQYLKSAKELLTNLDLMEIWEDELLFYSQLLKTERRKLASDIENDNYELFKSSNLSSSTDKCADDIIESSYFKGASTSFQDYDNGNCDKIEENELNLDVDEDLVEAPEKSHGNSKITAERLAKTLKKHSLLNSNPKMAHLGIITGKQKKVRKTKRKSPNNNKEESKPLPKKPRISKKKNNSNIKNLNSKTVLKIPSDNESEKFSDEETDGMQILNCVPSVNDVFDGLKISFVLSDDESDDLFVNSQPLNKSELNSSRLKAPEPIKAPETEVASTSAESLIKKSSEKKSPQLNLNSLKKLHKFSFVSRKTDINQHNVNVFDSKNTNCSKIIDFEGDSDKLVLENSNIEENFDNSISSDNNFEISQKIIENFDNSISSENNFEISQKIIENSPDTKFSGDNLENTPSSSLASTTKLTLKSIFESSDEDLDVLDI